VKRSEWRSHHALRRAAEDVALPNVVFRRLGSSLEVSWDNETWGTARPGLAFVEQRGAELVDGVQAARVFLHAIREVTKAVAERERVPSWQDLAGRAAVSRADEHDWRWLVPIETARTIETDLRELDEKLREHTRSNADGWFVAHTRETLTLRQFVATSASELELVLRFVSQIPQEPVSDVLRKLIAPAPPPRVKPWLQGYERALDVREELGWGDDPLPELTTWLRQHGVTVDGTELARSIDLLVLRSARDDTSGWTASMALNPHASSRLRSEIAPAAGLGHLLMDAEDAGRRAVSAIEGAWEDWPSAARARAFGVMLRLPTDGDRQILQGTSKIDARHVAKLMERFDTGPMATTWHLKNLGFIDEERRGEILGELLAA